MTMSGSGAPGRVQRATAPIIAVGILVGAGLTAVLTDATRMSLFACAATGSAPLLAALAALAWTRRRRGPRAPGDTARRRCAAWDRGSLAGAALLLAAIGFLLHESLFLGRGLVPVDGITAYEPWRSELGRSVSNRLLADQFLDLLPLQQFLHDRIVLGEFPLWNPGLACGLPNLASMQSAPLFPINLLLSPLDPFASRGIAALAKLFLAGLFTLLYMRRLGASSHASALSALAFSFSGFMIVWLGHPHSNSAMWLPLLLFLIEGEFPPGSGEGGAPPRAAAVRSWIAFATAYGVMLLGGHPPTILHVSGFVAAYFAFRVVSRRRDGIAGQRIARFGAALACGVLLASVQWLPFLEYYGLSSAAASASELARSSASLPLPALLSFLVPYAAGSPVTGYEQLAESLDLLRAHNFNERTGFFGVTTLYLAGVAVALRHDRVARFFALAIVASLCVVYGVPPLPRVMGALPVLHDVNHTRLLLIVGFAGSVLGGLGLDRLGSPRAKRERTIAFVLTWFAVAALLGWLWIRLRAPLQDPAAFAFAARQVAVFVAALMAVTLATLVTSGTRLPRSVCLAALGFEMLWFAYGYNPSIERRLYYPETPGIRLLRDNDSISRVIALGKVLPANTGLAFQLQDVRGRDYMSVRRYEELIRGRAGDFQFMNWISEVPASAALLNLEYWVTHRDTELPEDRFSRVHQGHVSIYRAEPAVERVRIVRRVEALSDPRELLARVRSQDFDPRVEALLEESPPPIPDVGPGVRDSVRITGYTSDAVTIDANLGAPGLLVLFDTYFPGWKAFVGGRPTPVYRANYNFRAVALPAGASQLQFEYRPRSFAVGLSLSLMSAALLGFGAWTCSRPREPTAAERAPDDG